MQDNYGSDFLTIADEDGNEFELEVLTTVEYNGCSYYAVIPADNDASLRLEVTILKSVDEDGESILCVVEDEQEAEAVNNLIMDALYDDTETDT